MIEQIVSIPVNTTPEDIALLHILPRNAFPVTLHFSDGFQHSDSLWESLVEILAPRAGEGVGIHDLIKVDTSLYVYFYPALTANGISPRTGMLYPRVAALFARIAELEAAPAAPIFLGGEDYFSHLSEHGGTVIFDPETGEIIDYLDPFEDVETAALPLWNEGDELPIDPQFQ